MKKESKRNDMLRLRSICQLITEPFSEADMDWMTTEHKLMASFQTEDYPIYRRKILRTMPVKGLWWMDSEHWVRFLWAGHTGHIIKSGQDPDRVFTTRSFEPDGHCYIRETAGRYDLEARSRTTKWCPVNKTSLGTGCEWMTVSITTEEYDRLQPYLGARDEGCKHG